MPFFVISTEALLLPESCLFWMLPYRTSPITGCALVCTHCCTTSTLDCNPAQPLYCPAIWNACSAHGRQLSRPVIRSLHANTFLCGCHGGPKVVRRQVR